MSFSPQEAGQRWLARNHLRVSFGENMTEEQLDSLIQEAEADLRGALLILLSPDDLEGFR